MLPSLVVSSQILVVSETVDGFFVFEDFSPLNSKTVYHAIMNNIVHMFYIFMEGKFLEVGLLGQKFM